MSNSQHPATGRRVAVIDIGTNTLLLLLAEVQADGTLQGLRDLCRFGRLGKGLDTSGALNEESIARSLAIVREYRAAIDELGVDRVVAVGTQALREARNAERFVGPAAETLGVDIDVIAGRREAELVYRAVAESFPALQGEPFAVADVGGGSTEIIVAAGGQVSSFDSVPIGSVRMTERHLHADPPTPEQVTSLIGDIDAVLAGVDLPSGGRVVGTAGTATSMASVALGLRTYDADRVQGFAMSRATVDQQLAHYWTLPVAERRKLPGLEPERADVIAAGVAIFSRLLHRVAASEFLINSRGVRWGVAYEAVSQLLGPSDQETTAED